MNRNKHSAKDSELDQNKRTVQIRMAKDGKRRMTTVLLCLILTVGIVLLLYPTVSSAWNSYHQTQVVISYTEQTAGMDEETRLTLWNAAREYNETLAENKQHWQLTDEEWAVYSEMLNIGAGKAMGYIEIPSIKLLLPIYHGTDEAVLQEGVGHLEGSSLPIGGLNSHTVLSGHRGLPSARLFTDLDKLAVGDIFYLHVLEETLAYEVDQILTVEPDELEYLEISLGEDLCTLITCTPYGINSHRLLVRGHRVAIPTVSEIGSKTAEEVQGETLRWSMSAVALIILIVLIIVAVIRLALGHRIKKNEKRRNKSIRQEKR